MSSSRPIEVAILLGAATGIRSMTGIAAASWSAMSGDLDLEETRLAALSQPDVALAAAVMAAEEVMVDKLPFLPDRTATLPILARMSLGALAGAAAYLAHQRPAAKGALIGAAAAATSARLSLRVRQLLTARLHLPDIVAGMIGDAAALALARRAMH